MEPAEQQTALEIWAQRLIRTQVDAAGDALAAYCKKPKSAKRLHAARKQLARLRAALDDLSMPAGVAPEFRDRVQTLHKRAGRIRDADVLLARLDEYDRAAFGTARKELNAMARELRRRRKKARSKFLNEIAQTVSELHR
ncbi:MAG TPA: CHAD domain-containing protein [Candidatus Baltobacteraceae bacterium]|nr:CHAD domain-containing protein [Candidatus Baltobacteraceae bacterium]